MEIPNFDSMTTSETIPTKGWRQPDKEDDKDCLTPRRRGKSVDDEHWQRNASSPLPQKGMEEHSDNSSIFSTPTSSPRSVKIEDDLPPSRPMMFGMNAIKSVVGRGGSIGKNTKVSIKSVEEPNSKKEITKKEIDGEKNLLNKYDSQSSTLKELVNQLKIQNQSLQEENKRLGADYDSLRKESNMNIEYFHMEEEIKTLKESSKKLHQDFIKAKEQNKSLQELNKDLFKERDTLMDQKQEEVARANEVVDSQNRKILKLQEEMESLHQSHSALQDISTKVDQDCARLTEANYALEKSNQTLTIERDSLLQRLEQYQDESIEQIEKQALSIMHLESELKGLHQTSLEMKVESATFKQKYLELNKEKKVLEYKNKALAEDCDVTHKKWQSQSKEVKKLEEKLRQVRESKLSLESRLALLHQECVDLVVQNRIIASVKKLSYR